MTDYRIAIICGLGPLITGIVVFLLWLLTGNDMFMAIGMCVLAGGVFMFVGGMSALLAYVRNSWRDRNLRRSSIVLKALLPFAILLGNFPVAYGIARVVINVQFPSVPSDWVKARSYEFIRHGPNGVDWKRIGDGRWYFEDYRFGIRHFRSPDKEWTLVFAPDGDGPYAYVLLPDHVIKYSPDDAMSCGHSWLSVNSMADNDRRPEYYQRWNHFR